MSIPLEQALQAVDLKPGETYRCEVRGYQVELRVLPKDESEESAFPPEQLAPMEPWVALPGPTPTRTIIAQRGPSIIPDAPDIPQEESET